MKFKGIINVSKKFVNIFSKKSQKVLKYRQKTGIMVYNNTRIKEEFLWENFTEF